MPTLSLMDIRFLLSRSRGEWLPEEQNGLVPQGPTGIRDVQGLGNNTENPFAPGFWFGAGDTLFPRWTYNRLTTPGKQMDVISEPFTASPRGQNFTIKSTDTIGGKLVDALNPRNISNLVADSSNPVGFQSLDPNDPNYAAKLALKLQDDPTGRVSPLTGAVNPLAYSNWMSQFGQFFDHGLDFVSKGVDGKVQVDLLPSDGLYTAGRATAITASRNNTVNVTIGEGSTDALLVKLGIMAPLAPNAVQKDIVSWEVTGSITDPTVPSAGTYKYEGTLVLNNTLIKIAAINEKMLVDQINAYTPTTGVTATATFFPAIPGVSHQGAYQFVLTPAVAESFNQTSPFIDLSQNYGSDASRTVFLREYLDTTNTALGGVVPQGYVANVADITTGRLLNGGATVLDVQGEAGMANWQQVKANAALLGITLHDADIGAIPLIAFDANGKMILDAGGMPQLVALNRVTGEIVYVKDTSVTGDLVLMTTKHAFLNDMGVRLPAVTDATVWSGRDLRDVVTPASQFGPAVNYKTALEAHFVSGDGRLNENIGLTAVHEAFLTEHNRVVTDLKTQYGFTGEQPVGGWNWTDPLTGVSTKVTGEELFQQAKLVLEMEYQHLVFDQFVRKLSPNIAGFAGVNPLIDAKISSEFANAVYRLGHSMLPETVGMRKYTDASSIAVAGNEIVVTLKGHSLSTGSKVTLSGIDNAIGGIAADRLNGEFTVTVTGPDSFKITLAGTPGTAATGALTDKIQIDLGKNLMDAFLNPQSYTVGSTSALLADGSSSQVANRIDEKITDALRDNLLGQPLDLATLNLIRGRDAGLPTLNEMRAAIQGVAPALLVPTLAVYTSWANFRDNLKGTLADQNATVKNFMMAYASDDILTKFASTKTLAQWYTLRDSAVTAEQNEYMAALKAATEAAFADATWMATAGNKDFNRIDAWIGGLAEREVLGGMLGSTFDAVFAMQMMNLQNGDKFYYLGRVAGTEFFGENIEAGMLSDLVMRGTGATGIYGDIFSVADKYIQLDGGQPAAVGSQALLQASTTIVTNAFDTAGNVISASIGRAGYVTENGVTTFYGNLGNYLDARGVLNPNGVGNASEMISGTTGNDRIFGMGGNDTIRADAGNDVIDGGSGADFLYGDAGNDTIDGGAENDRIYGGTGNDTLRGGLGIDTILGNDGDDTMYGGLDGDVMIGGKGNDIMYGGDGVVVGGVLDPDVAVAAALLDDSMSGGAGDDTIYGGGGWDAITGDSGHDIIDPGTGGLAVGGRESMDGGEGDDLYVISSIADFASHDIADSGLTQLQRGTNTDTLRALRGIGVDEVRFTDTVAGDIVLGAVNTAVPGALASVFTGIERVVIGTGTGLQANRNGTANINIDASLANPGINLGLEILGNAGSNTIIGTAFDDKIDGGAGADLMEGGIGNDTYTVDQAGDVINESLAAGGGGNDSVILTGNFDYTLADDLENLTISGNVNNNRLGIGNALDNVITGNGNSNTLRGLAGNDTIDGGGGNDNITGGAGIDRLTGGLGDDTFVFASVADIGNNAALRETITDFGTGVDRIDLTAIDADTTAVGHQAFQYIGTTAFTAGQAGRLRYEAGVLYGDVNGDAIADFQLAVGALSAASFVANPTVSIARSGALATNGALNEGNTGTTAFTFSVNLSAVSTTATAVAWAVSGAANAADFGGTLPSGTLTIAAGSTTGTITVQVSGDTTVEANEQFTVTLSSVTGGNAILGTATATATITNDDVAPQVANTMTGTAAADTMTGTAGNDIINGLAGNDILNGGDGNDTINGGDGSDTLNGGLGDDTLLGGAGADTLNGGTGIDVLDGGTGTDTLIGSAGRDTMTGGTNNDVFRFTNAISEIGVDRTANDIITDFVSRADIIDLAAIDANTGVGNNQSFSYIGTGAFTGAAQVRLVQVAGTTWELQGNVNADNAADFVITLQNFNGTIRAADFIL